MGNAWLDEPNAKTGVKGLAGDLHAVSAIRDLMADMSIRCSEV